MKTEKNPNSGQENPALDPALKLRIEKLAGSPLISHRPVEGGYTPALRLQCESAGGSFFVKVGVTALTAEFLRREISIYRRVSGDFMPRLLAWEDHEQEPILIIDDLSGHAWPPPWNRRRIDLVLSQIDALHGTRAEIEPFDHVFRDGLPGWQDVAADPGPFLSLGLADDHWLQAALPLLLDYEARCTTAGDHLAHFDLRSDNIAIGPDRAIFVDWNLACLSNPRLDTGFWLPSLAAEGGPKPETILPDAPDVAARVSGYMASRAGLPPIPDAPNVRRVQRQQLETALPWAVRALGLSPPFPSSTQSP